MSVPGRLQAPRADRAVLAEPPLRQVGELLRRNRQRLTGPGPNFLGRPWAELRLDARRAMLAAARHYLAAGGEPVPVSETSFSESVSPVFMAGHQPELFHPGVWVKNFALSGLARAHGGAAINLVVDNDTVKSTGLRLPALHDGHAQVRIVPFDAWAEEVPYEERTVRDEGLLASFLDRAGQIVQDWPFKPLLHEFWGAVGSETRRTTLLGERFAAARRALERRWGCHNLEVPVSRVCQTEPFAWFAVHLLSGLPAFHSTYNAVVHEYRERYGLRSRNHPVPDLAADGDWLETPFWAWRTGQSRRGRLMARLGPSAIDLRVGNEPWPSIPLTTHHSPLTTISAWLDLERQGYKVRSRALTNTLFARLLLCDLFVHGIGGGKYDELTDEILQRHYGIAPPGFLVLSATLLLPFAAHDVRPDDCHRLGRLARDLRYNPQRHLDGGAAAVRDLVRQKEEWIGKQPATSAERRLRFETLRRLNDALRPVVAEQEMAVHEKLVHCRQQLDANAVLRRRDYAFVLYPEADLRAFCSQFLQLDGSSAGEAGSLFLERKEG